MTKIVYVLVAIDPVAEGVDAIGPFFTEQEANDFADGQGGGWTLLKVTSP